jgi:hypothetical protein
VKRAKYFVAASIGYVVGALLGACGAAASTIVDPVAYAAELQACVRDGKTRAEVDVCRHGVDARYGQLDAGAE